MTKSLILFLLFSITFSNSQKLDQIKLDQIKLDDYFQVLEDNQKVMGSVAISKDDKIIYTKTIGFADAEKDLKSNENTEYRVGSITKIFTAVLIMKAVEDNLLKLDEKLSKFFPEVKNSKKITVENLLNHRSGIADFTNDAVYIQMNTQPISKVDLVKIIVKGGSDFKPDSKYAYSNSNYVLLSLILEKLKNQSYLDLLEKSIIIPLELKNTRIGTKINSNNNEAFSYFLRDNKYEKRNETDLSISLGSGNIVSTPSDLLVFIMALQDGKLISKESVKKMQTFKDGYGLGLSKIPFYEKTGFGHSGRIDEFLSVLYYFPESRVGFAMVTNQTSFDNNKISVTALRAAHGLDYKLPNFTAITLRLEDLQKFVGTYSTTVVPMKIEIIIKNDRLVGRVVDQEDLPLEPISGTVFQSKEDQIEIRFNVKDQSMIFMQSGHQMAFKKENKILFK